MIIQIKNFNQLETQELYEVLQLRSEIFVVEQDCVYQDIDGKDEQATHLMGRKKDKLVGYTRIFGPGQLFKEASIGRVMVKKGERTHGYGKEIMEASIEFIRNSFGDVPIRISAQTYLFKFYTSLGFVARGSEYLEDGIPHIEMIRR